MNNRELNTRFPDLKKAEDALQRAAERAKRLAEQTGTRLIVSKLAKPTHPTETKPA